VTLTSDTAEEQIEQILSEYRLSPVLRLGFWPGQPISVELGTTYNSLVYTKIFQQIDSIIENADLVLCLTSKYPYIRECKKYYEESEEA